MVFYIFLICVIELWMLRSAGQGTAAAGSGQFLKLCIGAGILPFLAIRASQEY